MKLRARILLMSLVVFCSVAASAIDRQAFTFTNYDLKVKIDPAQQGFVATGTIVLRNDSNAPQKNVALQITRALQWQSVTMGDKEVPWLTQPITSDIDHTGELSEAILTLPEPVAPGKSITINVAYGGTIPINNGRLLRIGAPGGVAERSDWDQISESFTAVRGLGYVVWYPVALDPVSMSDENALWDSIGAWKRRHRGAELRVSITAPSGLTVVTNADESTAAAPNTTQFIFHSLDALTPTFVAGKFEVLDRPNVKVFHTAEHTQLARDFTIAAERVGPMVTEWVGPQKQKLVIVELTQPNISEFDDGGSVFFTPLAKGDRIGLELTLAHQWTHTAFFSPRPWIEEGFAHFIQFDVLEREAGHANALKFLGTFRETLAAAETQALNPKTAPGDSNTPKGQPLATTNDQIYFRSKGAYVWWMLRDLVGEDVLKRAMQAYKPQEDTQPGYLQSLLEAQTMPRKSLEEFFDDWVYRDRGLPDFKIQAAYPRPTFSNSYVVSITVENLGDPAADVPVMVQSDQGSRSARTHVAAHGKGVVRIEFPGKPTRVVVNDGSVPETNVDNNSFELQNVPPLPEPH